MLVAEMPKKPEQKKKPTTVNIGHEAVSLLRKICAFRNLSMVELFDQEDVRDFFTHALAQEMMKEKLPGQAKK